MRVFIYDFKPDPKPQNERVRTLLPMQPLSIWLLESYEERIKRILFVRLFGVGVLSLQSALWLLSGSMTLFLIGTAATIALGLFLSRYARDIAAEEKGKTRELLDLYGFEDVYEHDVSLRGDSWHPFVIIES